MGAPNTLQFVIDKFEPGLHTEYTLSKMQLEDSACTCADNVVFFPVGTITKRAGRVIENTTNQMSGAIIQIHQWRDAAMSQYLMAFTGASADGDSKEVSGTIAHVTPNETHTATLTYYNSGGDNGWNPLSGDVVSCEGFAGSAFFCDGNSHMLVFNGSTCISADTDVAGNSIPYAPRYLKSFKNYLFMANTEEKGSGTRLGSRLWWSDPGDGHTWPDANYLDLDPDDGDEITGMELLGNELIVFKNTKIYAISYVGGIYEFFSEIRVEGKGCKAPQSISTTYGDDLVFYDGSGMWVFDGRNVKEIASRIKDVIVGIHPTYGELAIGSNVPEKNWMIQLAPMDDTGLNTDLLIFDYFQQNWTVVGLSACSLGWFQPEADLTWAGLIEQWETYSVTWGAREIQANYYYTYAGTYDGWLLNTDGAVDTDDYYLTAASAVSACNFDSYWTSKWIDFGLPHNNKRITRITVYLDKSSRDADNAYNIAMTLYKDWNERTALSTHNISTWDSNDEEVDSIEKRVDTTFHCRTLKLKMGLDDKAEGFTIHKIVIDYIPKGRTKVA